MTQPHDFNQQTSLLPFRSHTALLLATALPYLQPFCRHPVELMTKFLEFSETMKLYREFHSPLSFTEQCREPSGETKESGILGLIGTFVLDLEGLLSALSQICTGTEKEIITMFLNLIHAKNFYENYGDLMQMFMGAPAQPEAEPSSTVDATSILSGDLTSMLNNEQMETLNLLKSLFENED